MGCAGCRCVKPGASVVVVLLGLGHQGIDHIQQLAGQQACVFAQVQPQVVGGLVVARPARPQLAAECAQALGQQALDEGVHVLVARLGCRTAGDDVGFDLVQRREHACGLAGIEQAGALELARVGAATAQVLGRQPEVGRRGRGQAHQGGIGAALEATAPQQAGSVGWGLGIGHGAAGKALWLGCRIPALERQA